MTGKPQATHLKRLLYGGIASLIMLLLGGFVLLQQKFAPVTAAQPGTTAVTRCTAPPGTCAVRTAAPETFRVSARNKKAISSTTTASIAVDTTALDAQTSQPLKQEAYLAALMAVMEEDGRDNALFHYAMAFELAPPHPTPEQAALIKMVLDEGWDERAESLLPYLLEWQEAFEKLHFGASLDYARGVGFEKGVNTPVPDFLSAQNAGKMLAVYSRYLESQGRGAEALTQINTILTMGRDFNSPGNFMISNLIGTAIQSIGLRQLSSLASSNTVRPSEFESFLKRLQYIEQGQPNILSVIDNEFKPQIYTIRQIIDNPGAFRDQHQYAPSTANLLDGSVVSLETYEAEYLKIWVELSEQFAKPYWERYTDFTPDMSFEAGISVPIPNFLEAEVRFLNVTSRLRQQQIHIAVQRYMTDHQNPPPGINTLVTQNYLQSAPVDPFTGQPFTYLPTQDTYQLYGSGPDIISPVDPGIDWSPANGILSPGIIRLR